MTRGIAFVITPEFIFTHDDFNGNMDWGHRGKEFAEMLRDACSEREFNAIVDEFNDKFYGYSPFACYRTPRDQYKEVLEEKKDKYILRFGFKYAEYFLDDYVFTKNCTEKDILVIPQNLRFAKEVILHPLEILITHFGKIDEEARLVKANGEVINLFNSH